MLILLIDKLSFVQKISSIRETFGVGTLRAMPSSFPFNSGIISPIDFEAPVEVGIIDRRLKTDIAPPMNLVA